MSHHPINHSMQWQSNHQKITLLMLNSCSRISTSLKLTPPTWNWIYFLPFCERLHDFVSPEAFCKDTSRDGKKQHSIHQSFPLPRRDATRPPPQALQIMMLVWLNSCQQLQWPKRVWEQDSASAWALADSAQSQATPASCGVWYLLRLSSRDPSPSAHPSPCHSWLQRAAYPHCGTGNGSTVSVRAARHKRHW